LPKSIRQHKAAGIIRQSKSEKRLHPLYSKVENEPKNDIKQGNKKKTQRL
jgi:hypothetical protein